MNVKLSTTSKMPCKSWSLQAIDTCPGSVDKSHPSGLVELCRGCYATQGFYHMPVVKESRRFNKQAWKRKGWVDDMAQAIGSDLYFRWFDSGDVYSVGLARKIKQVIEATPDTKHWLPTRMYKFEKVGKVLAEISSLPNAAVRWSSDSITGELIEGASFQATVVQSKDEAPKGSFVCEAYERGGKCEDCRACWDSSNNVIALIAHGATMKKQYTLIATEK